MWRIIQVVCVCFLLPLVTTKSISDAEERSDNSDLPDASALIEEFYNTVEAAVHHIVFSRDMHKLVREKRQLNNNFGGGNFGQGSLGGFGQGGGAGGLLGGQGGDILGGIGNIASLASLDALGSEAASGLPFLSGLGQANRVVKTVMGLDRMKCASRLACEYMANRGLFNRTSALVPSTVFPTLPANAQGALNLSHPSTFRVVLGALQLVRFQEFGAYDPIEAGLWGVAHRDHNRCRSQFTRCPSTAEAFITELNSTPGGLQSMVSNSLQTIRNTLPGADSAAQSSVNSLLGSAPQTAANVADFSGGLGSLSNFGQQAGSALGSLAGLGGLGGNQQFGANQFGANQFGSNQQFGANQFGVNQFGSNQQFLNPSGSQFGSQQLLGSQFGGNQQFLNPSNLQLGGNQQFLNPAGSQFSGGQQFLNPTGSQFGGLGANFASSGLSGAGNFNPASLGLNGASSGFGGLNGLGGVSSLGGLGGLGSSSGLNGLNGFGSVSGLNGANLGGVAGLNNFNGFGGVSGLTGGSQFGSQFAGQGFQQGLAGNFNGLSGNFNGLSGNFRSGTEDVNKKNPVAKPKWKWFS